MKVHSILPADIARCRPGGVCKSQDRCARFLAPLPAQGATVQDFLTAGPVYGHLWGDCQMRIPPGDYRPKPERRVHPPFGEQA